MSHLHEQRHPRRRVVAAAGAFALAAGGVVLGPSVAQAVSPNGMTITQIGTSATASLRVAADTGARLITITGTNFAEEYITDISLGADTDCQNLTSYIVTSPTSIAVKTPANGCAPTDLTANPTGEVVTIDEVGTTDDVVNDRSRVNQRLIFVPPPTLAAAQPVVTETSSALPAPFQVTRLLPTGNQLIRVRASGAFAFDGRTAAGLAATIGGRPVTAITVYQPSGALQGTAAPQAGNYFTARTPAGLAPGAPHTLIVTQDGVSSRGYSPTETGLSWVAVPQITSLDVREGNAAGGRTVRITGTGFSATLADYTAPAGPTAWRVRFCGVDAPVTAATATLLTVTAPDPGTATGTTRFGGDAVFDGVCDVRVVDLGAAALTAPSGLTGTGASTGGTLAAGSYVYRVSALSAFGETPASTASTAVTTTGSTSAVALTWSAVTDATGYKVYGRTAGSEALIATVAAGTTAFTDTGAVTPSGAFLTVNTSGGDLSSPVTSATSFTYLTV